MINETGPVVLNSDGSLVSIKGGRAKGSSKQLCWDTINKLIRLIFGMSEAEMANYVIANEKAMSRAEKVLINESNDPRIIWALLERCVGKSMPMEEDERRSLTHEDIMKKIEEMRRDSIRQLSE